MQVVTKVTTTTRKQHTGIITLEQLRKAFNIPANARVTVRVPGGADWSNTDLDIGSDVNIDVSWEEVTTDGR